MLYTLCCAGLALYTCSYDFTSAAMQQARTAAHDKHACTTRAAMYIGQKSSVLQLTSWPGQHQAHILDADSRCQHLWSIYVKGYLYACSPALAGLGQNLKIARLPQREFLNSRMAICICTGHQPPTNFLCCFWKQALSCLVCVVHAAVSLCWLSQLLFNIPDSVLLHAFMDGNDHASRRTWGMLPHGLLKGFTWAGWNHPGTWLPGEWAAKPRPHMRAVINAVCTAGGQVQRLMPVLLAQIFFGSRSGLCLPAHAVPAFISNAALHANAPSVQCSHAPALLAALGIENEVIVDSADLSSLAFLRDSCHIQCGLKRNDQPCLSMQDSICILWPTWRHGGRWQRFVPAAARLPAAAHESLDGHLKGHCARNLACPAVHACSADNALRTAFGLAERALDAPAEASAPAPLQEPVMSACSLAQPHAAHPVSMMPRPACSDSAPPVAVHPEQDHASYSSWLGSAAFISSC